MKIPLIIIGTGDYAEVAFHYLQLEAAYEICAFVEEENFITKKSFKGLPIHKFEEISSRFDSSIYKVLVAVGPNKMNTVRERLFNLVKKKGYDCIKYVHSSSIISDLNSIGENSFIFPGCIVEPFATVGNNCVLWSGSILAHHSVIHDHCFIAPGCNISGRVMIKNNCFLGINSTIRDHITIAEKSIIGAGAIIKKDTLTDGVYSATGTTMLNKNSLATNV